MLMPMLRPPGLVGGGGAPPSSTLVFLLNGGGTDGAQDMLDQSEYARTLAPWGTGAVVDSDINPDGNNTVLFDGSVNAWIALAEDELLNFGADDFTIRIRYRASASRHWGDQLYGYWGPSGGPGCEIMVGSGVSNHKPTIRLSYNGETNPVSLSASTSEWTADAIVEAAFERVGPMLYVYVGGVIEGSVNIGANAIHSSGNGKRIGLAYPAGSNIEAPNGHLSKLAIYREAIFGGVNYTPGSVPWA